MDCAALLVQPGYAPTDPRRSSAIGTKALTQYGRRVVSGVTGVANEFRAHVRVLILPPRRCSAFATDKRVWRPNASTPSTCARPPGREARRPAAQPGG